MNKFKDRILLNIVSNMIFFLLVINQALNSMNERFLQFKSFNNNFDFLYNIEQLKNMNNDDLIKN